MLILRISLGLQAEQTHFFFFWRSRNFESDFKANPAQFCVRERVSTILVIILAKFVTIISKILVTQTLLSCVFAIISHPGLLAQILLFFSSNALRQMFILTCMNNRCFLQLHKGQFLAHIFDTGFCSLRQCLDEGYNYMYRSFSYFASTIWRIEIIPLSSVICL